MLCCTIIVSFIYRTSIKFHASIHHWCDWHWRILTHSSSFESKTKTKRLSTAIKSAFLRVNASCVCFLFISEFMIVHVCNAMRLILGIRLIGVSCESEVCTRITHQTKIKTKIYGIYAHCWFVKSFSIHTSNWYANHSRKLLRIYNQRGEFVVSLQREFQYFFNTKRLWLCHWKQMSLIKSNAFPHAYSVTLLRFFPFTW